MISFYPGPSRVYDAVPAYVKKAHRKGILSMNHRSPEFEALVKKTVALLKSKLSIPANYTVFFTGSATECWEIIAQSLVRDHSTHIYNGAFGEKWHAYTKKIRPAAEPFVFDAEMLPEAGALKFPGSEVICFTQNETSNGTQVPVPMIKATKKNNPKALVAVDATSSMGGVALDFTAADIWFASVQKCFGLPAGLGIMACSPAALRTTKEVNERNHYNSLVLMAEMMEKWQTPFTPNVLGIYLLKSVLRDAKPIRRVEEQLTLRQREWVKFFSASEKFQLLVRNPEARSATVIAVTGDSRHLERVKADAKRNGFLLGEGYGALKRDTFRIANFPALKKREIRELMKFLIPYT